jgi:hypothetical protein
LVIAEGLAQLLGRTAEAAVFGGGNENGQGRHFVHVFPVRHKRGALNGSAYAPFYQARS